MLPAIDPGHCYSLAGGNELNFVKKQLTDVRLMSGEALVPPDAKILRTFEGTTNEEVLEALIDRTTWLDTQFPCDENKAALAGMRAALDAFNARTDRRTAQGIEGQLVEALP